VLLSSCLLLLVGGLCFLLLRGVGMLCMAELLPVGSKGSAGDLQLLLQGPVGCLLHLQQLLRSSQVLCACGKRCLCHHELLLSSCLGLAHQPVGLLQVSKLAVALKCFLLGLLCCLTLLQTVLLSSS
jgi:hypothetical protein